VADQFTEGHRFRTLTVLDAYTRECLAIHTGTSLRGRNVVAVLNQTLKDREALKKLCGDNGSECTVRFLISGPISIRSNGIARARETDRQGVYRIV
jgi:putative transposase